MPAPVRTMKPYANSGFTLTELMMAMSVMGLVSAGGTATYLMSQRIWHQTSAISRAYTSSSTVLERILVGVGEGYGLRSALPDVGVATSDGGWTITYEAPSGPSGFGTQEHYLRYVSGTRRIEYSNQSMAGEWAVVGRDISGSEVTQDGERLLLSVTTYVGSGRDAATSTMETTIRIRNYRY